MDEETKKITTGAAPPGDEFNRTVVMAKPERRNLGANITPLRRITARFSRKTLELEDFIGSVDVSRFTSAEPDTTAQLSAPLSNLETRYSVLEEVARGGHATIAVARDRNLRRIVAIKSLKKDGENAADSVDAFVAEAKVTAQLDHPAIIPIYGLTGDGNHGVHLSMKLVNGKTLRDYLRNLKLNYKTRGIRNFDEAALLRKRLELFLRVCDAVAYAHHRNIMHRDLKPENIMLGEYMEVYVMDWGLAKPIPREGEEHAEARKIVGTPRYFPPEALRGERCDARADIFSLGLILQEIVTLRFAIGGKDEKECMERIVNGEAEPIEHLFRRRIDRALKAIIRKATAYRVGDRYQSVAELAEDLRRYMGGLSVSAYPDNVFMKISRYFYRRRREFMLGFLALLFGCAAVTAHAIHRQLGIAREMNRQRRAMNFIYNRTGLVSNHLDITALHIQEQLSALSRLAAYMLAYNRDGGNWRQLFRPTMSEIGKTEAGMFFSPYYKRMTSLDYGIYTLAPGADRNACFEFIRKVSPALAKMKNIVLGSRTGYGFAGEDYEKRKTEYLYRGAPVRSVFIGSEEGVKLLYPWRGNYPREIDPRKRSWYCDARRNKGPTWGKPYMDFDSISGLSIPCSVPIYDLAGVFRGVVGLDLSVNQLTESILGKGNTGDYVIEKAVVNREGETIFSSESEYFNKRFDPDQYHRNAEFKTPLFRTAEIRKRILGSDGGYGTFVVGGQGRRIICSFAHLKILDMYFVVVADYDGLIRHIERGDSQPFPAGGRRDAAIAPAAGLRATSRTPPTWSRRRR